MTRKMLRSCSLAAALLLTAALQQTALAGPPLLCHPIEIGDAKSLPWAGSNWRDVKKDYDLNRLVADTLALLTPEAPVLTRMETLRRATIYAVWAKRDSEVGITVKSNAVAEELQAKLMERIREAVRLNKNASMALFDAGYLDACYKQAGYTSNINTPSLAEGYAMVRKASHQGGSPEIEFALAIISEHPRQAAHQQHLQKALAGAKDGSLLARNLVKHFGKPGQSLSTLRTQIAAVKQ
ncbi:MAG TPA: hypothetical protein PKC13_25925 [Blastocatellia bacterium]|nr:hypothetical protein [Blastocatellia bacterium]HMY76824.1 hypothetical protein [Blastocatellia bacterium]